MSSSSNETDTLQWKTFRVCKSKIDEGSFKLSRKAKAKPNFTERISLLSTDGTTEPAAEVR